MSYEIFYYIAAKDPWDPDTFMIVPVESSQTILPESAAILGIKTFLKLARLPCKVEEKFNASNISPNGKLQATIISVIMKNG